MNPIFSYERPYIMGPWGIGLEGLGKMGERKMVKK